MKPSEVKLTSGPPITFREHLEVYGSAEAALETMKKRCEACHNWVCATYIDQIEHYIREMMLETNPDIRGPVMEMLYEIETDVADWIDTAWRELESKYGIEKVSGKQVVEYRLKGMPEAKMKAILRKKANEIIQKFEDLMYSRLGKDKYSEVYSIRYNVRNQANAPPPPVSRYLTGQITPEQTVTTERKERVERVEEIKREISRLKKMISALEKELEKEVNKISKK